MGKATDFFTEGLLLEIKHYGGNIVEYAVVQSGKGHFHLWRFNPHIGIWIREVIKSELKDVFNILAKAVKDNPKMEDDICF